MPKCSACGDEADELVTLKVDGKNKKLCEECAEEIQEGAMLAEESEAIVQKMMGFQGRR